MCTSSPKTKAASPAVDEPVDVTKPDPLPTIQSLQKFLSLSYSGDGTPLHPGEKANLEPATNKIGTFTLPNKEASISIVLIDTNSSNNHYAEINGTKMHYSGSLVKVGALYTAFDLRAEARKHAKANSFSDQNTFFTSLTAAINTSNALQRLKDFGQGLKPDLTKIFKGFKDTGPDKVEFLNNFQADLNNIGENVNAGRIIRALGYSYINISMMRSNFFDPVTLNGIWLAGDYSGEGILKSVRVLVENDIVPGGSGQAITTKELSRMFQLLHTKKGFSNVTDNTERAASNEGAHDILVTEGSFFQNTTTTVHLSVVPKFSKDCAKVGIGTLGPIPTPGPSVISEGAVMKWGTPSQITTFNSKYKRKLTGDFALCWQNMYAPNAHFDALVRIINSTIEDFLTQ